MKQRKIPKERNQFVALVLFRKAGSHKKTTKQVRLKQKKELTHETW